MAEKKGEEPTKKRSLNKEGVAKLRKLFAYPGKYKGYFILGLFFLVLSSLSVMAFPYVSGQLIDLAQGKGTKYFDSIGSAMLIFGGILILQAVFSFFRVLLFARVSEYSMADLRKDLFSSLMLLPVPFYDSQRSGDLLSRITSDVSSLQDTFSTTLAELIRQFLTLLIGIIIIFFMASKLSVFMLATFPILVVAALIFGRYIRKLSRKTQDLLASANTIAEETLGAVRVVKAFSNEFLEIDRYKTAQDGVVKVAIKSAIYRGLFISFVILALFGGIVAVLWYGAVLVKEGAMTSGELVSFIIYTAFIGGSVAGLGDIFGQIQRAIGASERILEILEEEKEAISPPERTTRANGSIEFKGINFNYPARPDVTVLKDVNFAINSGERVALVGHSGAGKSTIVQLLLRHYQTNSGKILLDGKDINSFELAEYRQHFGIVPQEITLFGGSVRENIAYGKPTADEEEIIQAAQKANAWEFIDKLPEKLETLVGDKGIKLSGGQRQRIAIARAILKDPCVLILDEATSNLDAQSEQLVQEALDTLMKGRTTIIIAHRLATIRQADNIMVLQQGEVIESGLHEELIKNTTSVYSNLVKLQLEG